MFKSESRRWELILKEINNVITTEEKVELESLQKEVFAKTKLLNKKKPSLVDAESY